MCGPFWEFNLKMAEARPGSHREKKQAFDKLKKTEKHPTQAFLPSAAQRTNPSELNVLGSLSLGSAWKTGKPKQLKTML